MLIKLAQMLELCILRLVDVIFVVWLGLYFLVSFQPTKNREKISPGK